MDGLNLLVMNDRQATITGIRPFCVPITEPFAQACVETLRTFRELADKALTIPDGGLNRDTVFYREADALLGLPEGEQKQARLSLHQRALDGGHLIWVHAVDHIRALEHDILMQPPPVWSPLTLARVTLEGCAFTGYLYDPAIPLGQRLARVAGMAVAEARNEATAAVGYGPEEQAGALAKREDAEKMARAAGAEERQDRRGRVMGYSVDGEYAPMDHKIGAQIKAFLPAWGAGVYPLLSGAAHGRPWMIVRGRTSGDWAGEAATVLTAVIAVMGSLEAGLASWAAYLGADVTAALGTMDEVRMDFLNRSFMLAHGEP